MTLENSFSLFFLRAYARGVGGKAIGEGRKEKEPFPIKMLIYAYG